MSIELYHHGSSVCAAKVRLALAEKGIKWDGHYLDILAGEHHNPKYLKLNPKAVVPTLVHDGQVIRESTVICEYVDDAFSGPKLKPNDPLIQANMRLWTKLVDEEVHPSVRPITYVATHRHKIMEQSPEEVEEHIENDPDPFWRARKRGWIYDGFNAPDVKAAIQLFNKLLGDMETSLQDTNWLVSNEYTLADTALTPYLNRLEMLSLMKMWDKRPNVTRWFENVKSRPSFQPAIFEYFPEELRTFMIENGRKAWPKYQKML
ncbi:glutathione S-transferase family protein [Rhodospirillales bacterium]|nr:glutathione S-transferase family protein [Rhodospirillales bacterium]